jgi:NAD(P) transhydrogenase subunit alpha
LGAHFNALELEALEGAGGYAREMAEERAERQRQLLTPYVGNSDAVITTAAVPGRPAPLLVTTAMVEAMRPGSVLVDLAAESGGNCELSRPGEDVEHHGVLVHGLKDAPSAMAVHASQLYARNVVNLLLLMTTDGEVVPDFDDEIVAAACVTRKEPA